MNTSALSEDMVRHVTSIPDETGANACFGSPIERNGHTVIPVARVSFGYGLGFGRGSGADGSSQGFGGEDAGGGEGEGGGGGGGGNSQPVAVIEIGNDGVSVKPITDSTRIALTWMTTAAWLGFWLFWTIRTISRERAKTRVEELKHASG